VLAGGSAIGQLCFHLEPSRFQAHKPKNHGCSPEDCPLGHVHMLDAVKDATEQFGEKLCNYLHDSISNSGLSDISRPKEKWFGRPDLPQRNLGFEMAKANKTILRSVLWESKGPNVPIFPKNPGGLMY